MLLKLGELEMKQAPQSGKSMQTHMIFAQRVNINCVFCDLMHRCAEPGVRTSLHDFACYRSRLKCQ